MTTWRKSRRSGGGGAQGGQECVEIARIGDGVAVRDSKDPDGARLLLSATHWRALTHRIKAGEIDHA